MLPAGADEMRREERVQSIQNVNMWGDTETCGDKGSTVQEAMGLGEEAAQLTHSALVAKPSRLSARGGAW